MNDRIARHITKTPGICGGRACIAGHRIRVADIVNWHLKRGYCPDEVVDMFPGITLADVHAALAYYFDHREEIEAEFEEEEQWEEWVKANCPSKIPPEVRKAYTANPPFAQIRHLLSDKPLFRPRRRGRGETSRPRSSQGAPLMTLTIPEPLRSAAPLYRLSLEQYEKIAAAEILTKRDNVHLIHGYLIAKMTKHPPHAMTCANLLEALFPAPPGWFLSVDHPVRLSAQTSEPEPDFAIVRGQPRDYLAQHPGPENVALIIEVAASSLADDQREMFALYGSAGIPVYWIVNVIDRRIEIYSEPIEGGYRQCVGFREGQMIPLVIENVQVREIPVAAILP